MRRVGVFDLERMLGIMNESATEFAALPEFGHYTDEEREVIEVLVKRFCLLLTKNLCMETVDVEKEGKK